MPRIYILLMSVLISAFYACDHRGKPYPATLSRIESLADTNPEEARPLLDRLRDSLSSFDEEQRMYYDLLDLKVNDKMYVRHTSDSLIKRITAFYEMKGMTVASSIFLFPCRKNRSGRRPKRTRKPITPLWGNIPRHSPT